MANRQEERPPLEVSKALVLVRLNYVLAIRAVLMAACATAMARALDI